MQDINPEDLETEINYAPITPESYDAPKLNIYVMDEIGQMALPKLNEWTSKPLFFDRKVKLNHEQTIDKFKDV